MEWDRKSLGTLSLSISERCMKMRGERKTDRLNFSIIWANHLKKYGITVLRDEVQVPQRLKHKRTGVAYSKACLLSNLIETVNFRNERVADALIVNNPDRITQSLLVPRDVAERILVLGMP